MARKILTINPGSTSTKIALFEEENQVMSVKLSHTVEDLKPFEKIYDQTEYRRKMIMEVLEEKGVNPSEITAISARGGNMQPVVGGTYMVNEQMLEDLKVGVMGQHASNLGGIIANAIAKPLGISAYVVDPVIVDEMAPIAKISGTPDIARKAKDHPLNQKAVSRKIAEQMGGKYEDYNFIVAHTGGGISIGVHEKGKIIDTNNCLDGDGPMSPERSGGVPFFSLVEICYSGKYTKEELRKRLVGGGGLAAYLGTNDAIEVTKMIEGGDEHAKLVFEAMAYQVAKEIGAGAAVLKGKVDRIIITGGLAYSKMLMDWITERVEFIAPVELYPGELEMDALALGVLRVLDGNEPLQQYPNPKK